MYLMGSNWSSAYRSASRGNFLLLLLCIVRLQLGSRWVRVSCRVRFIVRVSFTVRVSVRVIQVAILSCKLRQLNNVVSLTGLRFFTSFQTFFSSFSLSDSASRQSALDIVIRHQNENIDHA